jgi:hypothetical protein
MDSVMPGPGKQCTFSTDCPIGFRCDVGNCIR